MNAQNVDSKPKVRKETKNKIENRIRKSILIPPSTLVLNWGEYGSGKTHDARFFNKVDILNDLAKNNKVPLSFYISFPKSKEPVKDIYTQIIILHYTSTQTRRNISLGICIA